MSELGREQIETSRENVVSLFGRSMERVSLTDPLDELLKESKLEDFDLETETPKTQASRKMVDVDQFPDQSMFVLEQQLSNLKSSLNRIKFYLGDLEDLIPR